MNEVVKQPTDIAGLLDVNRNALLQALPKAIKIDRFLRVAMNAIARNPDLQKCSASSLYGAIMQSAQFGLEIGLMNQAHLVPYWNSDKRCFEAQFQIGYLGLRDMAEWYGDVEDGDAQVVYEKDEFDYELGDSPSIRHKPSKDQSRGDVVYYYAWAKPKNGKIKVAVMSRQDVEVHRDKYVRKRKDGTFAEIWSKNFDAMAIKTVMRKCYKFVARSPQLREAIALDELQEVQIPQGLGVEMEQSQLADMRQSNQDKMKQLQQQTVEQDGADRKDMGQSTNSSASSQQASDAAPPFNPETCPPAEVNTPQLDPANIAKQFRLCESVAEWAQIANAWQEEVELHAETDRAMVKKVADEAKKRIGKK